MTFCCDFHRWCFAHNSWFCRMLNHLFFYLLCLRFTRSTITSAGSSAVLNNGIDGKREKQNTNECAWPITCRESCAVCKYEALIHFDGGEWEVVTTTSGWFACSLNFSASWKDHLVIKQLVKLVDLNFNAAREAFQFAYILSEWRK